MTKNKFNEEQILELKNNKYVKNVTENSITYSKEFKMHFINERNNGKGPTRIFIESGFNPYILGEYRINCFSKRINKIIKSKLSFEDNRGKKSSGRPKKIKEKELSIEEQFDKLKHENLMLKAENDLLKKMEFMVNQKKLKNLQQKKDIN